MRFKFKTGSARDGRTGLCFEPFFEELKKKFSCKKFGNSELLRTFANGIGEKSRATDALAFISHLPERRRKSIME